VILSIVEHEKYLQKLTDISEDYKRIALHARIHAEIINEGFRRSNELQDLYDNGTLNRFAALVDFDALEMIHEHLFTEKTVPVFEAAPETTTTEAIPEPAKAEIKFPQPTLEPEPPVSTPSRKEGMTREDVAAHTAFMRKYPKAFSDDYMAAREAELLAKIG
jgi:hypothetical protein